MFKVLSIKNLTKYLKIIILFVACAYLIWKIFFNLQWNETLDLMTVSLKNNTPKLVYCLFLMPVVILLEAFKWRILVKTFFSEISLFQSVKGIIIGISFAIFTPNRVGDLVGRGFALPSEYRLQSAVAATAGGIIQFFATVGIGLLGVLGFMYFFPTYHILQFNWFSEYYGYIFLIFFPLIFLFFLLKKKIFNYVKCKKWFIKLLQTVEPMKNMKIREILSVFLFSILRSLTFYLQLYILLAYFGVQLSFLQGFVTISVIFLFTSAIPSFAFSDIGIRGSLAVYFIGMFAQNNLAIVSATTLLWFVNLLFPAIFGYFFFLKVKL